LTIGVKRKTVIYLQEGAFRLCPERGLSSPQQRANLYWPRDAEGIGLKLGIAVRWKIRAAGAVSECNPSAPVPRKPLYITVALCQAAPSYVEEISADFICAAADNGLHLHFH
jgi:hypothetical protein